MEPSGTPLVRWYNSLIFRVCVLCVILLLCLLGSVYAVTGHYYREIAQELESRSTEFGQQIELWLEEQPAADIDESHIPDDVRALAGGESVSLQMVTEVDRPAGIVPEFDESGYVYVATQYFPREDQWIRVTARFRVEPQTELVRAFKNRNLVALTTGFLITLGLMIFLIARTLRPLSDLSETCAEISEGNLKDVDVRGTTGEVMALEQTFNRMVRSLREKEKVETNLRQAQRLSALGNLAAGVAHDVRNPLNAIKLLSSHAIDSLGDTAGTESAVKQVSTIRSEVHRLEEIVSGFLSLAKEGELLAEPVNVDDSLRECLSLVEKDAELRKVRLSAELRAGDTELMLDPKQWTRALLNVLINGLESCEEGGRVRMFSRTTDQTCEVEIRDDGPGMPDDVRERAFDPYFTTKSTGTGLGLSITRGIIEEHGGTIDISSSESGGCQVLITLPRSGVPAG